MAAPYAGRDLIEALGRHQLHMKDLQATLRHLKARLDAEGIPFAVVGATAMAQYGYVRHTEDIDIVATREGLDRIHEKLVGLGFVPRARGLRKSLRETEHAVNIDVIVTGEHAGSQDSPLVYPHPESDAFVQIGDVRYPKLEKLIEMKLVSGVWGSRPHDLGDVFNLIKHNGLDASTAELLIPEVRAKYAEMLEMVRNEKTLE